MSDQIPYLSDEELEKLIAGVENEPQVTAPDDLEDKVIARIVSNERKKTISFAGYCLRVGFGVAAAVALLCVVPFISQRQIIESLQETALLEKEIPTKEEVLKGRASKTKEEALQEANQPSLFEELKDYIDSID